MQLSTLIIARFGDLEESCADLGGRSGTSRHVVTELIAAEVLRCLHGLLPLANTTRAVGQAESHIGCAGKTRGFKWENSKSGT